MVSGRLREHNREKIAADMIEWAKKDDSLNLNGFCAEKLLPPSKISQWAKEDDFFRQAYEITKALLAKRREEALETGTLHVKAYDLNARVYDAFLREESESEKDRDLERKIKQLEFEIKLKNDNGSASPEMIANLSNLMNQLASLQTPRKIEDTSNKAEAKSA